MLTYADVCVCAGVMVYGSGDIYDGEWKSNMRHGFGCMIRYAYAYAGYAYAYAYADVCWLRVHD